LATDVVMPRLSDSMEEGTILKWLKQPGDDVARGEGLVEVETDKANMTYESDTEGVLTEIVAQEGDTLAIGEVIARIGDASEVGQRGDAGAEDSGEAESDEEQAASSEDTADDEDAAAGGTATKRRTKKTSADATDREGEAADGKQAAEDDAADAEQTEGDAAEPAEGDESKGGGADRQAQPSGNGAAADGNGAGRIKASPVARRMAGELGVELAQLEGSGPGGRIVKADVQAAADAGGTSAPAAAEEAKPEERRQAAPAAAKASTGQGGAKGEVEIQELTRLQQVVTRRMAESKATAPDFSLSIDVDMTDAVALRARLKEVADPAPSFNDMIVKAAATALREHPRVNGAYRDGKWELYERVNVGIAVAAEDTLIVPTVFDADSKSLGQISRDARAAIEKVRDQKITPPELAGGTFTVSNLGMYGIDHFTAIINPPQACILTVGALAKRPAVDEKGRVVARDQLTLTLVCDHRILYGADGAKFLARVKELLQQPLSLAL
jgi:pyruvate dehydrogenase E2 component (dihydrolipoamide acetyltransferase)